MVSSRIIQFSEDLPFTTLQSVIFTTGPFVFLWSYLKKYTDRNGRFELADTILENHNFLVATISLILAVFTMDIGHNILDERTGLKIDPYMIGYVYHILKIYEYLDVVLMVLAGKRVSKSVAFRHLVLPFLSWYRIIGRPRDAPDWRLHVILDCSSRFLSQVVPWVIENVKTEEAIVSSLEEGRWYGELAINAFWLLFTMQGSRNSGRAIEIFGKPYDDEGTARVLSVGLCAYAIYSKRQEDANRPAGTDKVNMSQLRLRDKSRPEKSSIPSSPAKVDDIRGRESRRK